MMKTASAHKGPIFSKPGIEGPDALISCIKLDGLQSRDKVLFFVYFLYLFMIPVFSPRVLSNNHASFLFLS